MRPAYRPAMTIQPSDTILVVDLGSQVTQLIARRVREAGVYCEIAPFNAAAAAFEGLQDFFHRTQGVTRWFQASCERS